MEAQRPLLQAVGRAGLGGGRRLLGSDCTVVGSVGVGGSIALLLLIGFTVGAGVSCLFFWWRERRRMRIELEYRNRFGDSGLPDVSAMVKAAHNPTIGRSAVGALTAGGAEDSSGATGQLLGKAASALAQDGPLAMGAVSSFKNDPLRSLKEQQHPNHHTNPLAAAAGAAGMARSSSGNPFSTEVPSFRVRTNDACSLNNTPASSINGLPSACESPKANHRQQQAGLIGTGIYGPAADPSSPRITKPEPAPAAAGRLGQPSGPSAAASPFAWPGTHAAAAGAVMEQQVGQQQQPAHTRNDTVVLKPVGPTSSGSAGHAPAAASAAPSGPAARGGGGTSGDYLAALDSAATNPFETPALRRQQEEESGARAFAGTAARAIAAGGAAATVVAPAAATTAGPQPGSVPQDPQPAAAASKAAQKEELLQQVQGEEYGDEELDPEWASLLGELDACLQAAGRARLSTKERAVAIRSLIVATTSQSADAALAKAQHDVEAFRRAQSFRTAA